MHQISIFDGANKYVNDKPIRLIECFAGYGSQALAFKYLGIPFEHHRIAEWAVKSIQAYKDMHFPDDDTDYSCGLTFDNVIDYLFERGISADYNKPMTREQIKRMGENKCRTVYNNIKATHNLVSVCNVKAKNLPTLMPEQPTECVFGYGCCGYPIDDCYNCPMHEWTDSFIPTQCEFK